MKFIYFYIYCGFFINIFDYFVYVYIFFSFYDVLGINYPINDFKTLLVLADNASAAPLSLGALTPAFREPDAVLKYPNEKNIGQIR